jgi:signal transduction histidine kinase
MHREAERLVRLAEDLGRLSDAQRPGLMLTKERVDLADIARERIEAVSPQLREQGLKVDVELRPARVDGDPARLAQIVDNLLSNALRYSDPGGTVTVRTATHDDAALLTISDTGIGINPEDLPHIYERFWRSEKSRARVSGGTGIGLAIVRELVRAHDGQIEVQSTAGASTSFEVRLPLSSSAASATVHA